MGGNITSVRWWDNPDVSCCYKCFKQKYLVSGRATGGGGGYVILGVKVSNPNFYFHSPMHIFTEIFLLNTLHAAIQSTL